MEFFQILFMGGVIGILLITAIFGVIPLAAFIYVLRHAFPVIANMATWAARPQNLFSLLILTVLLFVVIIFGAQIIHTLFILFIIVPLLLSILVQLAILVWLIRLAQLIYRSWRTWLITLYYSTRLMLARLRIEIDTLREEGARNRLNGRSRPSNGPNNGPRNGFKNSLNNRLRNNPNKRPRNGPNNSHNSESNNSSGKRPKNKDTDQSIG